jgi:hypothetical protein
LQGKKMRKKRILWVNEWSRKHTGYAVYGNEILKRLNQVEEFEVAELACHASEEDLKLEPQDWKVYANRPPENSEEFSTYVDTPTLIFGYQTFNSVC